MPNLSTSISVCSILSKALFKKVLYKYCFAHAVLNLVDCSHGACIDVRVFADLLISLPISCSSPFLALFYIFKYLNN